MARSQKFTFSNPLRKASAPTVATTTGPETIRETRELQDGAAKAQKLLGVGYDSKSSRGRPKSKKSSKELGTRPSQINITVSEVDTKPQFSRFGPAVPTESGDDPFLRTRPSSPLLGQTFTRGTGGPGSMAESTIGPLRQYGSSSTLHSYYDPQKSPLAVSQQTSASSARDFALRKGCPPLATSQAHYTAQISPPHVESVEADEPQAQTSSKRRPPRIDLSMLFTKPRASSIPLLSPQRLMNSPSPQSTDTSAEAPTVPKTPRTPTSATFRSKRLKKSPPKAAPDQPRQLRHMPGGLDDDQDHGFGKRNVVKQRVGIKNWFDGVEGEISDEDGTGEPELEDDMMPKSEIMTSPTPPTEPFASYFPSTSSLERQGDPIRSAATYFPPTPARSQEDLLTKQVSSKDSRQKSPSTTHFNQLKPRPRPIDAKSDLSLQSRVVSVASKKIVSSSLESSNLQEQSVLHLSSSDDEGEDEEVPPMPSLRASLASAYTGVSSEVEFGTAKAAKPSFPLMANIRGHPPGRSSKPLTQIRSRHPVPVEPVIPDRRSSHRISSQVGENRSSMAPSAASREMSVPEDESITFPMGVEKVSQSSRQSLASSQSGLSRRRSRIMHVTRQEEKLLENMRQKRATMRQSILPEATQSNTDDNSVHEHRPRTSGAGVGDAERSFLRLSTQSMMPPRPSTAEGNGVDLPGSMEGTTFGRLTPIVNHTFPDRTSLVFSSDGALPSPSTSQSRASPVTPTLPLAADDRRSGAPSNRNSVVTFAPPTHRYSHLRGRTNSSHVIMLDAFDGDAKSQQIGVQEQEDFPLWDYQDYGDTIVH